MHISMPPGRVICFILDFYETRVAKIPQNKAPLQAGPRGHIWGITLSFQSQGANGAIVCFNYRFATSPGTCTHFIPLYVSDVVIRVVAMVLLRMETEMPGLEYLRDRSPTVAGCKDHSQTLNYNQNYLVHSLSLSRTSWRCLE